MKILHLNYSDSNGGASKAVKRLHDILNQNKFDTNMIINSYTNFLKS